MRKGGRPYHGVGLALLLCLAGFATAVLAD
ncbi:hypothetical protein AIGOOFII_4200 [Methylobacterium marchantiae]|nr:hypothetical protein AIGOOFII_4200 [Methylobacterium marchantiae]